MHQLELGQRALQSTISCKLLPDYFLVVKYQHLLGNLIFLGHSNYALVILAMMT